MSGLLSVEGQKEHNKVQDINSENEFLYNALILIQNREFQLATQLLKKSVDIYPENQDLNYWLALSLRESGRSDDSIEQFLSFISENSKPEALFRFAETLYQNHKDAMAIEAFQIFFSTVEQGNPFLFDAFKFCGISYLRQGDLDGAEEYFNKAFTLNNQSSELLVNYGTLEIQRNNFAEALVRFREALHVNKNNDRAWVGLAMIHNQLGDIELAYGNLREAHSIEPSNTTAIDLMISWLFRDQKLTELVDFIESLEKTGQLNDNYRVLLAKIYFKKAQYTKVREVLQSIESSGKSSEEYREILQCLEQMEEVQNV